MKTVILTTLVLLSLEAMDARAAVTYTCGIGEVDPGFDTIIHITTAETRSDGIFPLYADAFYTVIRASGNFSASQTNTVPLPWTDPSFPFPASMGVIFPNETILPDLTATVSTTGNGGYVVGVFGIKFSVGTCGPAVAILTPGGDPV